MILRALAAALAASTLHCAPAVAAVLTLAPFDAGTHLDGLPGGLQTFVDFEREGALYGPGALAPGFWLSTEGGQFQSAGGRGNGATSRASSGGNVALLERTNGQGDALPLEGRWSLNSNDTHGLVWRIAPGRFFDWIAFVLTDAADTPGVTTSFRLDGVGIGAVAGRHDGEAVSVLIRLDAPVDFAELSIVNARAGSPAINDAFSVDGVALGLTAVPLPGTGALLVIAMGALLLAGYLRRAP